MGCKLMTAVLQDRVSEIVLTVKAQPTPFIQNVDAEFVSLENIIPVSECENFSESDTLGQDFYDRVADLVAERIKQCGSRVPVVTGIFFRMIS